ncbi:MAG: prephenate dehydratase [Candidatus Muiribacteriaceae bacterium]
MKIGFQGTHGCHSEAALLNFFKDKDVVSEGFSSFEKVFQALSDKVVDLAFLPVENSIAGSVAPVFDLLLENRFFAYNEVYHRVIHDLLVLQGVRMEDISIVHSHPVALEQCRDFIDRHDLRAVSHFDTAGAAQYLKESGHKECAAIAPALCADLYGLERIKTDIADNPDNITRFFVIGPLPDDIYSEQGKKVSLVFKPRHSETSGALSTCLDIFTKYRINLTRVESRPDPSRMWEYVFYTDIDSGFTDTQLARCLDVLSDFTEFIKILGVYEPGGWQGL